MSKIIETLGDLQHLDVVLGAAWLVFLFLSLFL